jgi:hypothetical protein
VKVARSPSKQTLKALFFDVNKKRSILWMNAQQIIEALTESKKNSAPF